MNSLKLSLVIPLFMLFFTASAQQNKYRLILSPGVSYQKAFYGELNFMYAQTASNHSGLGLRGPRLGAEYNFNNDNPIFAIKGGYEMSILFICVRGSAVSYFDNSNKADVRLLPEAGLSLFGLANLTYGYGIPITSHKSDAARNRFTLTFNLSKHLWRDLFYKL